MTTKTNVYFVQDINQIFWDFFKYMDMDNIKIYIETPNLIDEFYNFNDHIKKIDNSLENFLSLNITYCCECLKKLKDIDENLYNGNLFPYLIQWKISVISNCFFNLPFTLQDVIFIPYSYIKESKNISDQINKKFSQTLIHEKIHIIQRYNQIQWNNYIETNTNWIISQSDNIDQYSLIKNKKILNPDTYYPYNFLLGVNKNSCFYSGSMYVDLSNKVKILWCKVLHNKNNNLLYPIDYSINKYEHPYEELAYEFSKKLIE
jgi:hypothetical protein